MTYGAKQNATQLTSITTEQFFTLTPVMTSGELHTFTIDVDFPATPVDDAIVALYATLDDSSEEWDDEPFQEFTVPNAGDTSAVQKSFEVLGKYKFRIGVRRSGTSDTITSADLALREDEVSA